MSLFGSRSPRVTRQPPERHLSDTVHAMHPPLCSLLSPHVIAIRTNPHSDFSLISCCSRLQLDACRLAKSWTIVVLHVNVPAGLNHLRCTSTLSIDDTLRRDLSQGSVLHETSCFSIVNPMRCSTTCSLRFRSLFCRDGKCYCAARRALRPVLDKKRNVCKESLMHSSARSLAHR